MGQIHLRTICFLIPILLSIPGILFEINPLAYTLPVVLLWGGVFIAGLVVTFRYSHRIAWIASLVISAILAVQLLYGVGPYLSSFWTNIAIIGVGVFYKESKMRVPEILSALEWGTKNAISIGAACACVGFIVGRDDADGSRPQVRRHGHQPGPRDRPPPLLQPRSAAPADHERD